MICSQAAINNLNGLLDRFPELRGLGLVELIQAVGTDRLPRDAATGVRNNAGSHYNHYVFWKVR
jgi:Fe-Mn family superoxide dismutase